MSRNLVEKISSLKIVFAIVFIIAAGIWQMSIQMTKYFAKMPVHVSKI